MLWQIIHGMSRLVIDQTEPSQSTFRARVPPRASFVLALLTAVGFLNYFDRLAIAAVSEPLKRELHLRDAQIGLLSGVAFALLYAAAGIPLARVADRGRPARLLAACLAWWSIMTSLTGLAAGFSQLLLTRAGVGLGEAGCVPAAHKLVGAAFPRDRRAFGISIFNAGGLAGSGMGLLVTGLLASRLGWRSALVVVGLAGLPLALLLAMLGGPARQSAAPAPREPALGAVRALAARPPLVILTVALAVGGFANYSLAQWLPAFYARSFGLDLSQMGMRLGGVIAIGNVGGVLLGGLAATRLVPREPRWELWIPALGYGGAAPCYAAALLCSTPGAALAWTLAAAAIGSAGIGVGLSAIQSFAEPHRRATAVALTVFLSSLIGLGLGPLATGAASDALQPALGRESLRYALLGSCPALLLAALLFGRAAALAARSRPHPAV